MIDIKVNKVQLRKNLATRDDNIGDWYPGYEEQLDKNLDTRWDIDRSSEVDEEPGEALCIYAIVDDDINTIYSYLKSDLSKIKESINFGGDNGSTQALVIDDTHVYIGTYDTHKLYKCLKSDLSLVAESADLGDIIWTLAIDNTYIYTGMPVAGGHRIKKYLKSNLTYVGQSSLQYNGAVITMDDTHIYAGSGSGWHIGKYLKSDLSFVGESAEHYTGSTFVNKIVVDDTHIYAAGSGFPYKIQKFLKSDLSYIGQSPSFDHNIYGLVADSTYIYAAGGPGKIRKYTKSGLSLVSEYLAGDDYNINDLAIDDAYIYAGNVNGVLVKIRKADMSLVKQEQDENYRSIGAMAVDI